MANVLLVSSDVTILNAALPQITVAAPSHLFVNQDGTATLPYYGTLHSDAAKSDGFPLQDFHTATQQSAEFASRGGDPYGITAATPCASVYATARSDPVNGIAGALVTSGGVGHQ